MAEVNFTLPQFEGPLELLLHLISKHKLDLYDINIAELVNQYTAYMERAEQLDMELTGDFLEMASRLVYMKTVLLLPRHEEEREQLKAELQGQLIEYQICRQIAGELRGQYDPLAHFVRNQLPAPKDLLYTRRHQPEELLSALAALRERSCASRRPPSPAFRGSWPSGWSRSPPASSFVLRRLTKSAGAAAADPLWRQYEKTENVATFLAVLELIKGGRIALDDESGAITLRGKKTDGPRGDPQWTSTTPRGAVEAVLFAYAEPLSPKRLSEILEIEVSHRQKRVQTHTADDCERPGRGLALLQLGGGLPAGHQERPIPRRSSAPWTSSATPPSPRRPSRCWPSSPTTSR